MTPATVEFERPSTDAAQANGLDSKPVSRRHDLDALRGVAMLLGIALHGILSFCELPWLVQDSQKAEGWFWLFAAIHGFRMPLFFLISGFFTMMLFRKRGIGSLLWHRIRRIFFPLLLGLVTIIPIGNWVNSIVMKPVPSNGASADNDSAVATLWQAVFGGSAAVGGDLSVLHEALRSNQVDLSAYHPAAGATPLAIATFMGHRKVAQTLIDHGADVDQPSRDGNAPAHSAAFKGDAEMFGLLMDAGADIEKKNREGTTPRTNCDLDWDVTKKIATALGAKLNRAEVAQGRKQIVAMIEGGAVDLPAAAADTPMTAAASTPSAEPEESSWVWDYLMKPDLLHHLWFLWSLFLLAIGFSVLGLIGKFFPVLPYIPRFVLLPPVCLVWLIPLTMLFESNMHPMFGPDTHTGLIPNWNLLAYYGVFFGYGALYFHCDEMNSKVSRWWLIGFLPSLCFLLPFGLDLCFNPNLSESLWLRAAIESTFCWLMICASMALFEWCLWRESKVMRYLSDSSYWLYLAHLPLVIWIQYVIKDWQYPTPVKAGFVIGVSSFALLVSYQILVRHTPIGWLLNGRRK